VFLQVLAAAKALASGAINVRHGGRTVVNVFLESIKILPSSR
jgi:hypothetical protein